MIADVVPPLPVQPDQPAKHDCHYERQGACNLFVAFEPLRGQRDVTVTDRRTKCDWADYVKKVVDDLYPQAQCITVVCDQLNTHTLAALYEAFPPDEAHRLARKIKLLHMPKHGSWLNMAEIEFSALARQCLNPRIPNKPELIRHITAWTSERNQAQVVAHWRLTTADACIKLASLYPKHFL